MKKDEALLLQAAVLDLSARLTAAGMMIAPGFTLNATFEANGLDGRIQTCLQDMLTDIKSERGAKPAAKWRRTTAPETGQWQRAADGRTYVLTLDPCHQVQLSMPENDLPGHADLISLKDGRYDSTLMTAGIPARFANKPKTAQRSALNGLEKQARETAGEALQKHTMLAAAIRDIELRGNSNPE